MSAINDPFNLLDYLLGEEKLEAIGNHPAIEYRGFQITYNRLREAVDFCCNHLRSLGVKEGDRVALLLYDSPEFIAYFLATICIKAICVPINTFLSVEEVEFILTDSGSKILLVSNDLAEKIDQLESDNECSKWRESVVIVGFDNEWAGLLSNNRSYSINKEVSFNSTPILYRNTPAFILYTSGSTGTPKGALHFPSNIVATIKGFGEEVLKLKSTDKVFSASRLFFAYGLGNSLSFPLAAGATVILVSEKPTPQTIARIFYEQRPTVFFGVPAIFRALLDLHANGTIVDTSSLRLCVSAGEALPITVFEEWHNTFGMTLIDGIGSTEMLHMFISNQEGTVKAGSSGKVVSGYEAKIIDDTGEQTPIGEQGNLWIQGASAMKGYWQRDDLTSTVIRGGWMRTGDIYRQDEEGYYFHIGRSDDCFKVKGLWISPIEIEAVLLSHPEVVEAAVVASIDENGLATVKAYLVIRKGSETLKKELFEFARARLSSYKTPTQIEFVDTMPRTSTGKIQRFKLRE